MKSYDYTVIRIIHLIQSIAEVVMKYLSNVPSYFPPLIL